MSKIQKELSDITEVTKKRGQEDNDFLKALLKAVSDLSDKDWNSLSPAAQDWFNEAADALTAKKDLPPFPDAPKEEKKDDEPPARTRRGAAKEEVKADPAVGDKVVIVTKRGKTITGKIVEIDKEVVVVDADGEELEVARDRIETMTAEPVEEKKSSRRKAADEEPEAPAVAEPDTGDNIVAVTARDKTYKGEVIEVADDLVVIKDANGDELELTPSKLKSLVIEKKEEATSTRRKAADDDAEPARRGAKDDKKDDAKPKRTSVKDNGGISATGRMRELIVDDMDAKRDEIAKLLDKEKIQYRPNTLDLVYADVHKLLKLMKEKKLIK